MMKIKCVECGEESQLNIPAEVEEPTLWECPKCNTRNTYDRDVKAKDKGKVKEAT